MEKLNICLLKRFTGFPQGAALSKDTLVAFHGQGKEEDAETNVPKRCSDLG